jgi:hypothetical protein
MTLLTPAGVYNLFSFLGKVPGVDQLGLVGTSKFQGGAMCTTLTSKDGKSASIKLEVKGYGAAIDFIKEDILDDFILPILDAFGLLEMKAGNPLAQRVALDLLVSELPVKTLIKNSILIPLFRKFSLSPEYLTNTVYNRLEVPFVGGIIINPEFGNIINVGERPECFGSFESPIKEWHACDSNACCAKQHTSGEVSSLLASGEPLTACYHVKECHEASRI